MKAEKGQDKGMSDDAIIDFVDYFFKSLHPNIYLEEIKKGGGHFQAVITMDKQRQAVGVEEI